nr:MG2 domain-containing protein [Candidatus Eremiobacteraeota bacterium]
MKRISIIAGLALFFAVMLDGTLCAQNYDWYYVGQQANVSLPGTSVLVRYGTFSDEHNAAVRLFKVPLNVRLEWLRNGRYGLSGAELSALQLERAINPVLKHESGGIVASADFGPLPNGHYVAVWEHGAVLGGRLIEVGTLGSIWHAARSTLLVYSLDLRTMRRRSDVRYTLWRNGESQAGMVTLGGLAWLRGTIGSAAVLYGRASDGSETLQRVWAGNAAGNTGYIQTDRPIYRTGQRVYVRAVVRSGGIGDYVVPRGNVHLIVRSPDGTTFYDRKRLLSAFGTIAADFELPDSAHLGSYTVTVGNIGSSFSVEQYKKPEYSLNAAPVSAYVIGGHPASFAVAARYFFGAPAAGMNVHYTAQSNRQWIWQYDPYSRSSSSATDGGASVAQIASSGTADENGHLSIVIPTKHVGNEEQLSLSVDGRDASGRTVTTSAALSIVPASFWIAATPDRWYASPGDEVNLSTAVKNYDGKPRPNTAVRIEIHGTQWGYENHRATQLPVQDSTVVTDARGMAALRWHPEQAASYEIRLSGTDEGGNVARSTLWFWVSDPNTAFWYPNQQIAIIPDKERYRAGERPKLLISVPATDADGLLIVSNDRIRSAKIVHVGAKAQTVEIDSPKDATYYTVRLEVPGKTGVAAGETQIRIIPPPPLLKVTLTSNKPKYAPGERATFGVRVRKMNGRPVRAELGIGIVDQALYAVQADRRTSAMDAFYDGRTTYVAYQSSWSLIQNEIVAPAPMGRVLHEIGSVTSRERNLVPSGTTSDVYSVASPSLQGVPVRAFFPDTAYWKPDIRTDGEGNASFSFTWPDTLTTWHATGDAVDMNTSVGAGMQDTLVTKDFLVRLEMPRFLRRGDRSQFTGIVNGKPGATRAVMRLDAGDLLASGTVEQTAALDSNFTGNAAWNVTPLTSLGDRAVTLTGSNGTLNDAMRLTIPIEAAGAPEHVRDAAEARDRSSLDLRLPEMYDAGSLHITLSPSALASLLQNVRMLDVYPYDCTEQTMSSALPSVFLDRALKRAGIAPPKDSPATATVLKHAVARLSDLQHADGSWGWWEHDDAHPFMTAYALYGLAEFRKSGFSVPETMYDRGVSSLLNQLQGANSDTLRLWGGVQAGSQWNTRAFMLFALADAAPQRMDRTILDQTMEHAGALND